MKPSNVKKIAICLTAFIVSVSTSAEAQKTGGMDEIIQELFIGETVFAQEKKEIQFTSKPAYWKTREGSERIDIPLLFEYGFTDRFQVELKLPYQFLYHKAESTVHGPGNVEAGFLYNILNGNKPFALSVALDIGFPTGKIEKDMEEEAEIEWEPSLIIARQFGKMQVHAGVAAEIAKSGSSYNYNLATVFPFGDWLATLELNGKFREEKAVYVTPGLIWKGIDDFEFGLGVSKNRAEWGVIFMATYEFSLRKK